MTYLLPKDFEPIKKSQNEIGSFVEMGEACNAIGQTVFSVRVRDEKDKDDVKEEQRLNLYPRDKAEKIYQEKREELRCQNEIQYDIIEKLQDAESLDADYNLNRKRWKRDFELLEPGLDRGVARYVKILKENGVETCQSCEGGEGHSYPNPTVDFNGTMGAGWHALGIALDHGLPVSQLSRTWSFDEDGEPSGPYWSMEFSRKDDPDG